MTHWWKLLLVSGGLDGETLSHVIVNITKIVASKTKRDLGSITL